MFSRQNTLVSPLQITWVGVSMSRRSLPWRLRHLVSFAGIWLLRLGVQGRLHAGLWFGLGWGVRRPVWALAWGFGLIRLREFGGQQPAGPAGDGKTQVVSAKCLMSLNGHLLTPGGTGPPCFSSTRFIVEQCLLRKTSIWPLLTVWELPGHHIVLNTADTRHAVMAWTILFSPELFHIGIVCLHLWQMPSPQRSSGHSLLEQNFSQKFLCFFVCVVFCDVFLFYFIKISKFALPGEMLMYERISNERKKEIITTDIIN